MISFEELHRDSVIAEVVKYQNTTPLIEYLREGKTVTPELAALIADLLSGEKVGKPRVMKRLLNIRRFAAKIAMEYYSEILQGDFDLSDQGKVELHDDLQRDAERLGFSVPVEGKRAANKAAKAIVQNEYRMTKAQFDEFLSPRTARKKFA